MTIQRTLAEHVSVAAAAARLSLDSQVDMQIVNGTTEPDEISIAASSDRTRSRHVGISRPAALEPDSGVPMRSVRTLPRKEKSAPLAPGIGAAVDRAYETRADAAARRLYEAEVALHSAHQSHVDAWIAAASDKLHRAVVEHLAAITEQHGEQSSSTRPATNSR